MTRANYGSQKEQNSHRESAREKKKMRLNHRLLFWSPNLNPQIDLKTRLGKAKKMPKQPQFPALGRGPPFQSHPPAPKQFGFSFPRFAHFQASPPPRPRPRPSPHRSGNGPRLQIHNSEPHSADTWPGLPEEAPPPPSARGPRRPGIGGDSAGGSGAGSAGGAARLQRRAAGQVFPRHLRRRPGPPAARLESAPARERRFPPARPRPAWRREEGPRP